MKATSTINIALPADMRTFIESQVNAGGYSTISEYMRTLVREAQKQYAKLEFEKLVLEGLDSPLMDEKDAMAYLRQRINERRELRDQKQATIDK